MNAVDAILSGEAFVGGNNDYVGSEGGPQLVQTPGTTVRLVLPVASAATIAQNASADVVATPQRTTRVDRFAIAASTTANFLVNTITAAQLPMFIASGTLHADLLSSAAFGVSMCGWTVKGGTSINLNVTQLGATAAKFYAAVFGPTEF